jgi:hypothetical protein
MQRSIDKELGIIVGGVSPALQRSVDQVALALKRAAEEHARPNAFSCRELVEYGAPGPMMTGRIGKRARHHVWVALGGRVGWGSCPVYAEGRWYV